MSHKDPPHKIPWPDLEAGYEDEFGEISLDVYRAGRDIWPLAESFIARSTCDFEAGQRLLLKAIAIVTRKCREEPERVIRIKGYLFKTFYRLLMGEFEKQCEHTQRNLQAETQLRSISERPEADLAQTILVYEVLERADKWTRETFQLLILGHSLEEIAKLYGMKSNHLRSVWHKRIDKLTRQIQAETRDLERKLLQRKPEQ